jgi:hypothetical protein
VRLADRFVVMNRGAVSYRTDKAALDRDRLLGAVSI